MEFLINTPPEFNFKRTVLSHGWCQLLPFEFDRNTWTLARVIDLGKRKRPVTVSVSEAKCAVSVCTQDKMDARDVEKIARAIQHMLRLDDDMTPFYNATCAETDFAWVAREGAGRLLRSPTVFEDTVKTICTTNCSWALTEKMVTALVRNLGRRTRDGRRAFPTPQAMAQVSEDFYRTQVRAGYRAAYLKELAERVASGALDVEAWLKKSDLSDAELKREMKRIKGVGEYAADNLLKLIGRYDCLALDSWVRGKFARLHNRGRNATDAKIARYYSRFNSWRGLALWCDMTRDWIMEEQGEAL
jgi:N-glycosylase/DNA lyase